MLIAHWQLLWSFAEMAPFFTCPVPTLCHIALFVCPWLTWSSGSWGRRWCGIHVCPLDLWCPLLRVPPLVWPLICNHWGVWPSAICPWQSDILVPMSGVHCPNSQSPISESLTHFTASSFWPQPPTIPWCLSGSAALSGHTSEPATHHVQAGEPRCCPRLTFWPPPTAYWLQSNLAAYFVRSSAKWTWSPSFKILLRISRQWHRAFNQVAPFRVLQAEHPRSKPCLQSH